MRYFGMAPPCASELYRVQRLPAVQVAVEAARLQQLVVRALLDDLRSLDYEDDVGVADRAEVMREHDRRAPFHQPLQRVDDGVLRCGVEARGRPREKQEGG